jgi:hypothetical protein
MAVMSKEVEVFVASPFAQYFSHPGLQGEDFVEESQVSGE